MATTKVLLNLDRILLVSFASMGGLLSGLDQSLISGANLFLPVDLGLTAQQNSLVNSAMPLGAVGGALILSPCNEYFGRRWSILISCMLYTVGGALEAGSINYGMIVAARVILGLGVGLEGGTVPVYVAETVERRLRGNMVSLYQFNIALGEVLGYAVAAMFLKVSDSFCQKFKYGLSWPVMQYHSLTSGRLRATGDTSLVHHWFSRLSWASVCSSCRRVLAF